MTREEAIIELTKLQNFATKWTTTYRALNMAIEALKVQQWIPISKGSPEEKGEYMTTVEYYGWHGEKGRMLTSTRYTKTKGWHISNGKVIAWMPLPEPYKED